MTDSLMKIGNLDADNVKTQREDGHPQAKERPGADRFLIALRKSQSCQHLDLRHLVSRTV